MDNRLLLVNSIILLHRESLLDNIQDHSNDLVMTSILPIPVSEITVGFSHEMKIIQNLKSLAIEMASNGSGHKYDRDTLLQRLKFICDDDNGLYSNIAESLNEDLSPKQIRASIIDIKKAINNHFREAKVSEIIEDACRTYRYRRGSINVSDFISGVMAKLTPLQNEFHRKDKSFITELDIGDSSGVSELFHESQKMQNGEGILKTGFQGLDIALEGGIRRGEQVIINAMEYNYKSTWTLCIMINIALYNRPHMLDPTKKPMLVDISFEDDIRQNLSTMYKYLKFTETKEKVRLDGVSREEMTRYVQDKVQVNGFSFKLIRCDPSTTGYSKVCQRILELESEGYEIHAVRLDYPGKQTRVGCENFGVTGSDFKDMMSKYRVFFMDRMTTCICPHQLSSDAKTLIRGATPDDQFVNEVAGKGYQEICRTLSQIPDIDLYIHKAVIKGPGGRQPYLTCRLHKHKEFVSATEEEKYFAYAFPRGGMPIPSDYGGGPQFLRSITGKQTTIDDLFKDSFS